MRATADGRWVRQVVDYDGQATGSRILEKLELLEQAGYESIQILNMTPFRFEIFARRRELPKADHDPHAPPPAGPGMDFR